MRLINKDSSFFNYLTKHKKTEEDFQKNHIENNDTHGNYSGEETKNSNANANFAKTRLKLSKRESPNNSKFDFSDQPANHKSEDSIKGLSPTKYLAIHQSHQFGRKNSPNITKNSKAYTSKEVREILDNYNEQYKSKKIPKENLDNNKSTSKEKQVILPTLIRQTDSTKGYSMIDNLNSTQKSQLFKSTIYNSMVPVRLNKMSIENKRGSTVSLSHNEKTTKRNTKSKTEYGPFLNFNYEEFNKKIEISNPDVRKLLEDLNYFGPHFSHCPSCRNKNLEFYETLEPSQCINILQFIKKSKKKLKK